MAESGLFTTHHMCLSVRGALRNLCLDPATSILGFATDPETGRKLTKSEIFDKLCDHLEQGHKVIPFGDACDRFDYQKGCLGHRERNSGTTNRARFSRS